MPTELNTIYLIGIGGIGISAVARILHEQGKTVVGSDQEASELTDNLIKDGIDVHIGHRVENLPRNIDLCIISPAIQKTNVELKELHERGVKIITYGQSLGLLSSSKYTIAIAGTHGKTTTTGLIGTTMVAASYEPTVIIGTTLKEFSGLNVYTGHSKYLVVEACEYKRSFLDINPDILLLLNIEMDHFDVYKDEADYIDAFIQLAKKVPLDGCIIANIDDENVKKVLAHAHCNVIRVSRKSEADYSLHGENTLYRNYHLVGDLVLQLPGEHNKYNALMAYALCHYLKVPDEIIFPNLYRYKGSWRRMEYKGKIGTTEIYDDYAHHPTEISASLNALREKYPRERICCIYQPHQYNRTKNLLKEFGASFNLCDQVIVPDIYQVRDVKKDIEAVSAEILVKEIKKNKVPAKFGNGLEKTKEYIEKKYNDFDVIVIMGAGDVYKITKWLEEDEVLRV